jgi:hyperosmotically inducible protein
MGIKSLIVSITGMLLFVSGTVAQEVYTKTDVREAMERIERHGDEFKHTFKEALENRQLSEAEKRVRDLAGDLEDEVDHLQKNYKDGHFNEARANIDNAMLMAASVDRFMQRHYFGPEPRRAWNNLRSDLNVIALGYHIPELPVLTTGADVGQPIQPSSADRMQPGSAPGYMHTRLEREVRHELAMLPYYGIFDNLAFRVEGNTVTLLGQVTRPTLKASAEQVVRSIEGVDRVINEIQVLPLSSNDDRIRLDVYRSIYGQAALNRYALQAVPPIHIIVSNGNVTLDGVVANQSDKNIAGIQARSVPGVFSVINNLRVE